jgi:hypothetical protein
MKLRFEAKATIPVSQAQLRAYAKERLGDDLPEGYEVGPCEAKCGYGSGYSSSGYSTYEIIAQVEKTTVIAARAAKRKTAAAKRKTAAAKRKKTVAAKKKIQKKKATRKTKKRR